MQLLQKAVSRTFPNLTAQPHHLSILLEVLRQQIVGPLLASITEEVGQAGRKASWVPVSNCARDFINAIAVVE